MLYVIIHMQGSLNIPPGYSKDPRQEFVFKKFFTDKSFQDIVEKFTNNRVVAVVICWRSVIQCRTQVEKMSHYRTNR